MKPFELPTKTLELNIPQMLISFAPQKHLNLEGGRGLGKSFIVGRRIQQIVNQMPRSKCAIVGRTYEQLFTRTLPSTINGLNHLGFVKGLHYWVNTRPPKQWLIPEAYEPPLSYDYCITFYNGTTFQLVSLDKTESGRGFNFDAVIGDEAALLDFDKLQNNVLLSMRGNLEKFRKCPLHFSTLFVSTTPVNNKGKWFLKREELALEFPKEYFYLRASSYYNLENLGSEYFRNLKRVLIPSIYNAEVECRRNNAADKPFYPTFNYEKHTYTASNDNYLISILRNNKLPEELNSLFDTDVDKAKPIDVAMDYNAAINWLICGQPGKDEYKNINAFFVKTPKTLIDVVNDCCRYYRYHDCKEVNYFYDHTAVHLDAMRTKSFSEEVRDAFIANGWKVNMIYCGQAPKHGVKRLFFETVFSELPNSRTMKIRINAERCKYMIASIEQAGSVDSRDGIKKDKSSEKDKNTPQEEATHGSDAFDTLNYNALNRGTRVVGFIHAAA